MAHDNIGQRSGQTDGRDAIEWHRTPPLLEMAARNGADSTLLRKVAWRASQALFVAAVLGPACVVAAMQIVLLVEISSGQGADSSDALSPLPEDIASDFGPLHTGRGSWRRWAAAHTALDLCTSTLYILFALSVCMFQAPRRAWPTLMCRRALRAGRPACELTASLWTFLAQVAINAVAYARSPDFAANVGISLAILVAVTFARRVARTLLGLGWASWGAAALAGALCVALGSYLQMLVALSHFDPLFGVIPDNGGIESALDLLAHLCDGLCFSKDRVVAADSSRIIAAHYTHVAVGLGALEKSGRAQNMEEMACLAVREMQRVQRYSRTMTLSLAARIFRVTLSLSMPWIAVLSVLPVQAAMALVGVDRVEFPSAGGILISPMIDVAVRYAYILVRSAVLRAQELSLDREACVQGCARATAQSLRRAGWGAVNAGAGSFANAIYATLPAAERIHYLQSCSDFMPG